MRPVTGARLKTGQNPVAPIGTATRLTTGMRPTTRGGGATGGATLNTSLCIEDRPITHQGLGGLKTGVKGPRRQIEDRSYFFGVLRNKINEISTELATIVTQNEEAEKESQSFIQYEQMAEQLASELRNLQGELGDYNTLVDKATIGHDIATIELDWEEVKAANERAELNLERLFEERKKREAQVMALETEFDQEKKMAESVVEDMTDEQRAEYLRLQDLNEHLLNQLANGQKTLDEMSSRRRELEVDIVSSQIKQEAMRLFGQLHEVEAKRDQLLSEAARHEDPQMERERLLAKVREDNRETANMDREIRELNEKVRELEDSIQQVGQELEDHQCERNKKFWELKKREQQIDQFLQTFSTSKAEETEGLEKLEDEIVRSLEQSSQYIVNACQTTEINFAERGPGQAEQLADQLSFKTGELEKSESTVSALDSERIRLKQDLQKIEQLEGKITQELTTLKKNIATMEVELETFSDLDAVRESSEDKRKSLLKEQERYSTLRNQLHEANQRLSNEYSETQLQLSSQDTHIQLTALEKKLVQHEQTAYALREAVALKREETAYEELANQARALVAEYNDILKRSLSTKMPI
ncbi:hypothetical protein AAHC03_024180 [Spirometra sp. Aus1]